MQEQRGRLSGGLAFIRNGGAIPLALAPAAGAPAAAQGTADPSPPEPANGSCHAASDRVDWREILGSGTEAQTRASRHGLGRENPGKQHQRRRPNSERKFAHDSLPCVVVASPDLAPQRGDAPQSIAQDRGQFTPKMRSQPPIETHSSGSRLYVLLPFVGARQILHRRSPFRLIGGVREACAKEKACIRRVLWRS